jgi:hypothetical protein
MAYIAPNSIVEVFTDIGLDRNYNDCLYFPSKEVKTTYFDLLANTDKMIGRYQSLSYQRETRNYVRVSGSMSTLINANYMRYKNTSYENKWFYAFIESVEYINNEVVQLNYVNDVMTTWMGEFELGECYIERMHSATDNIGDNLIPESFNVNDYVINETNVIMPHGANEMQMVVVICYSWSGLNEAVDCKVREGIFNGLGMIAFLTMDVSGINAFIGNFADYNNSIISIYMCKEAALGVQVQLGGTYIPASARSQFADVSISQVTSASPIDGYVPRNRKLYNYPFNYCAITNGQGSSITGKYEYAVDNTIQVRVNYSCLQPVSEMLRLVQYRGSGNYMDNFSTLTLEGYPVCNWASDAYKGWLAQNCVPYALSAIATAIVGEFNPIAASMSAIGIITNTLKDQYSATLERDPVHGSIANGSLLFSSGALVFSFARLSVNASIAQEIDKYFDMFGYAYNQLGKPSMNNRLYWTYLKTNGCKVHGDLPSDDAAAIENIIDHGARFWKGIEYIGKYSQLSNETLEW